MLLRSKFSRGQRVNTSLNFLIFLKKEDLTVHLNADNWPALSNPLFSRNIRKNISKCCLLFYMYKRKMFQNVISCFECWRDQPFTKK